MDIWNHAVANRPYDFSPKHSESIDSMRDRLAECGPKFLGHVRDACADGHLDDTFVDATSGRPLFFTYGGMIAHVLTYAAYRRTLVSGALHAAGVTDLEDDPLAWDRSGRTGPRCHSLAACCGKSGSLTRWTCRREGKPRSVPPARIERAHAV